MTPVVVGLMLLVVALVIGGARTSSGTSGVGFGSSLSGEATFADELMRAFSRFDLSSPHYFLQVLAMLGDTKAQLRLGLHYRDGTAGFSKDLLRSTDWILLSAEKGNAEAQRTLGVMYYEGIDVPRDFAHASRWLLRASEEGEPIAQSIIGYMRMEGLGDKKDVAEAKKWLVKAANAGVVRAQVNLGVLLIDDGDPDSQQEALKWFTLAAFAPNSDSVGEDVIKEAESNRVKLRRSLRVDQVEEAEADAHRWRSVHKSLAS